MKNNNNNNNKNMYRKLEMSERFGFGLLFLKKFYTTNIAFAKEIKKTAKIHGYHPYTHSTRLFFSYFLSPSLLFCCCFCVCFFFYFLIFDYIYTYGDDDENKILSLSLYYFIIIILHLKIVVVLLFIFIRFCCCFVFLCWLLLCTLLMFFLSSKYTEFSSIRFQSALPLFSLILISVEKIKKKRSVSVFALFQFKYS